MKVRYRPTFYARQYQRGDEDGYMAYPPPGLPAITDTVVTVQINGATFYAFKSVLTSAHTPAATLLTTESWLMFNDAGDCVAVTIPDDFYARYEEVSQ